MNEYPVIVEMLLSRFMVVTRIRPPPANQEIQISVAVAGKNCIREPEWTIENIMVRKNIYCCKWLMHTCLPSPCLDFTVSYRYTHADTEHEDMETLFDVLLCDFDRASEPDQLITSTSVPQARQTLTINPKSQIEMIMPSQSTIDRDDNKFIEMIEHYLQENEGNYDRLFLSSPGRSSSSSSRTDMEFPSSNMTSPCQAIENDENMFIETLEQLCRDSRNGF